MKLDRITRFPIARIAAVLTLFAVSPSGVRASCGDWLEHAETIPAQTAASRYERSNAPQPPVRPCQGLACENSPNGSSPLSPSEIRPPLPKDFAGEVIVEFDPPRMRDGRHSVEKPHPNAGCPLGVDRPPEALIPLS